MNRVTRSIGKWLATYLSQELDINGTAPPSNLARYLFPTPPVPTRFRRQFLSLGSGDPTRAICSTLIAQAFESIHYPIIALEPKTTGLSANEDNFLSQPFQPQKFKPKHHSLLTPRDFDVSPYFAIIKPTVECGFDFHNLEWVE